MEEVEQVLLHAIRDGLCMRYHEVIGRKGYRSDDVDAGRRYIAAYVPFVAYVEGTYEAAISAAQGHYPEPAR